MQNNRGDQWYHQNSAVKKSVYQKLKKEYGVLNTRFRREMIFRKDLIYQKKYLIVMMGGIASW